jgi:transcriptional regulator with XRE-family HTH domain
MPDSEDHLAVVARNLTTLRRALGWTQRELARRAGVSQSMVSRVEGAAVADLSLPTAALLLGTTGARLDVRVVAPYLGDRERQRDPAHARLAAYVTARFRRLGWESRTEVEVGGDRSRGWIDIVAFHPGSRVLLVIELKTEIHDLGRIERTLGWYERESWMAARRLGWRPRRVIGCLFLLATDANDARVTANRASIDPIFPRRARHLQTMLAGEPAPPGAGRAIAMVDPLSRRQAWLRSLRVDGRRSAAPYLDYADFMRCIDATQRRRR